jgi:hypothetical protein
LAVEGRRVNRTLHHVSVVVEFPEPTLEQVRENRGHTAPSTLECRGTTSKDPSTFGNPEWSADLEYVWREGTAEAREALLQRAKTRRRQVREVEAMEVEYKRADVALPAMRVAALRSAEWAEDRASAMAMSREDIVDACGKRWRSVRCGCTVRELTVGCEQPLLCADCRRQHAATWRKRIVAGMDRALREARREYFLTPSYRRRGMTPGIYLITLTGPHSGNFVVDRDRMGKAVHELLKHAAAQEWWSTYALTWEATKGEDGLGHLHVHLAVISSWIPYTSSEIPSVVAEAWCPERPVDLGKRSGPLRPGHSRRRAKAKTLLKQNRGLHEVWRDAMPGALVLKVNPPGQSSDEALSAGVYLAKYVTKGVDAAEFTGRKAGELLVALRCRRKVSTSAGFWVAPITTCPHCEQEFRSALAPCSMQSLAPAAVLRARAQRSTWYADGTWRRPGSPVEPPWLRRLATDGRQTSI